MSDLTTTEQYVLAQLIVSGDLSEGETRQMSDLTKKTLKDACSSLHDRQLLGPNGVRKDPFGYNF